MKTRMIGGLQLTGMLAGFLLTAVNLHSAEPGTSDSPTAAPPEAAQAITSNPDAAEPDAVVAVPQPPPPVVKLSAGAAEIVKLAQSGVGDDVMLAYVGNLNSKFNLGSDQIVYLNDLGVSSAVVKAMIERDGALEAASQAASASLFTPLPPLPTAPPIPDTADTGSVNPPLPTDSSDMSNPPPTPDDVATADDADYFYNSLAPYGNWVYVAGCGVCWQPTLVLHNHSWRPYCDRGRWLSSDCGWYWQSDYSWGWAAFHYGRWFEDPNRGWVWAPNRVWGPAWVSWRHSADYSGWAALPPKAFYAPRNTAARTAPAPGFDFGIKPNQYTFIPTARLTDYSPARYAVPPWQADQIHGQTLVANHFAVQNNRMVNHSIDPREVASLSGVEVRQTQIRDLPANTAHGQPSDRLTKNGNTFVIYRPQLSTPTVKHNFKNLSAPPIKTSLNAPHSAVAPPAASVVTTAATVARPPAKPETYPPGSLVVIGQRKNTAAATEAPAPLPNMNLSYLAHGNGGYYQYSNPAEAPETFATSAPAAEIPGAAAPAAGFNFNHHPDHGRSYQPQPDQTAPAQTQAQSTYVMPGRFTATQQLHTEPDRNFNVSERRVSNRENEQNAPTPPAVPERSAQLAGEYRAAAAASVNHTSYVPPVPVENRPAPHVEVENHYRAAAAASVARPEPPPAPHVEPHASPPPASSSSSSSSSNNGKR